MTGPNLSVLGGLDLRQPDGTQISLATRKSWALLAVLIASKGRDLSREELAGLLWPKANDSQGRASLRQELAMVRKGLAAAGLDMVKAHKDRITCSFDMGGVDVLEFERLLDLPGSASHRAALALYRGGFMAGLTLRSEGFEDWLWLERNRLRNRAQTALIALLSDDLQTGDDGITAQTAHKLLEVDPTQEQAFRALMYVHWRAGDRASALQVYQRCQKTLRLDLDTEPTQETVALAEDIRAEVRPFRDTARKTQAQPSLVAVLCLSLKMPKDHDIAPKDLLKAQNMLGNRVHKAVTAAGGQLMPGLGDRHIAVFHALPLDQNCAAALEVALSVIASPILARETVSVSPSAGVSAGEVLLALPKSSNEAPMLVGAALQTACTRAITAPAGVLVGGTDVSGWNEEPELRGTEKNIETGTEMGTETKTETGTDMWRDRA